ncbi:MAG: hypothetical protein Q8L36_02965 [bacterium]|nr:hypothetical protein [bacterium]
MKNDFEHNLIKGRVAEMVFEMMMRESDAFTIIPFGYENTIHELIHYQKIKEQEQAIRRIKKTPDFVVINKKDRVISLVEVKYRKDINFNDLRDMAKEVIDLWNPSWFFVATPQGFFFDSAENIVKNEGNISRLNIQEITPKLEADYLQLLNDFEKNN